LIFELIPVQTVICEDRLLRHYISREVKRAAKPSYKQDL
jgi:hypothetical protein